MKTYSSPLLITLVAGLLLLPACSRQATPPEPAQAGPSPVSITVHPGGPVVIRTTTAEFDVLPSGYVQASLLKEGKKLSLDDPQGGGDFVMSGGKQADLKLDFGQTRITGAQGKLGRGRRVEIPAQAGSIPGLKGVFAVEVYDDFPNLALTTMQYKNAGSQGIALDQGVADQHRLSASLADSKAQPYDLWSFQGSSYDWGKNDVIQISSKFSQPNLMGAQLKNGLGGGIPVVALWTASVGEAIGHLETLPLPLSIPVKVADDGRIVTHIQLEPGATLQPGDTYSTPRTFVAVYSGDYYEPLHLYSTALEREGWNIPKPSSEAYNVAWCGWGYEFNVTPKEMVGTIPKLKEMNIKWATLDDRWFNNYGDWEPRKDTFPGDSIKKMVNDFHKQGMYVQLWWLPLAVEDGQGRYESHRYGISQVVKEHPDWLILDKNGKHARMVRDLAVLDPSLPEVQAYYRQLTERFIRDWGFDGSKLDNIYTVPACYNPKHHHKSPQESVNAMAEVYKIIYQTSRSLKPESVTQSCPCGTPPSLAWLPYMDQAVTADPVGSVQVRRRIKMYKALLGPEAAVYGDHVELTRINFAGANQESDLGRDFASTIGTGGVVGTKFVWPDPGPHYKDVALTADKEEWWKKWIGIYNQKMLSKGVFRNLYTIGYDTPEGYAIEKNGKMYYAFFAPEGSKGYQGAVELRGLAPGTYSVVDYGNNQDLGTVTAKGSTATLTTSFPDHLLLEVTRK
ncbi:MAG TPA: alpha-galactosidase [Terriglobales bacterium]|nr:alpha-galactosidase [Terriglobales bacterium]